MWKAISQEEYVNIKYRQHRDIDWRCVAGGILFGGGYFTEWDLIEGHLSVRFEIRAGAEERYYKWQTA